MFSQGLGGEDVAHASTQCIACQLNGCCRSSWAHCSAFSCCWRCGCSADFSNQVFVRDVFNDLVRIICAHRIAMHIATYLVAGFVLAFVLGSWCTRSRFGFLCTEG